MQPRLCSSADTSIIPGLTTLLQDAVHGGASVGFMSPLGADTALRYWKRVFESIGDEFHLWVVEDAGKVVGSVQLELSTKENGRHRGEIQKLFVLDSYRGKSISSKLMAAAEAKAISHGRTLLILDTQAGSKAEAVYRHLGWTAAGQIPDYAKSPDGTLHATAYFYKRIEA